MVLAELYQRVRTILVVFLGPFLPLHLPSHSKKSSVLYLDVVGGVVPRKYAPCGFEVDEIPECPWSNLATLRVTITAGVPHSYETPPSLDPTVGLYLGSYGGPRGGGYFL